MVVLVSLGNPRFPLLSIGSTPVGLPGFGFDPHPFLEHRGRFNAGAREGQAGHELSRNEVGMRFDKDSDQSRATGNDRGVSDGNRVSIGKEVHLHPLIQGYLMD